MSRPPLSTEVIGPQTDGTIVAVHPPVYSIDKTVMDELLNRMQIFTTSSTGNTDSAYAVGYRDGTRATIEACVTQIKLLLKNNG